MKTTKILLVLLLCLSMICSLSACNKGDGNGGEPPATDLPIGMTVHGWVEEADLPDISDLTDWYSLAKSREQLTCTLLYALDETDGLWHCWLYMGCFSGGDTLSFEDADGILVIRGTVKDPDAAGHSGAYYFTLQSDSEPEIELYLNGSFEGILLTHADTSVKR